MKRHETNVLSLSCPPHRSTEFSDQEISSAFKFLDLDHNLHIGAAEIRHILICMGELITDEEVQQMCGSIVCLFPYTILVCPCFVHLQNDIIGVRTRIDCPQPKTLLPMFCSANFRQYQLDVCSTTRHCQSIRAQRIRTPQKHKSRHHLFSFLVLLLWRWT